MSYDQPMDRDRAAYNRNLIDNTVFAARKSGGVAYLLWVFVGGLGMHNFYLGRQKAGALQMAGTLLTYCSYVSPDPWPLAGMAIGVPLGISLLIDLFRMPSYVVTCSERLRARLQDDLEDWRGA
jgi:hypothetical protein